MSSVPRLIAPALSRRNTIGASSMVAERMISLVANFIVAIAITRYLGPASFGTLNYVTAFAAIIVPLSAVGLGELVTRRLLQRGADAGKVLGTAFLIRKFAGAIAVAIFALYCLFAPFPDEQTRWWAFWIVALAVIGDASVLRSWFVAREALPAFAAAGIVRTVVFAAARILAVVLGAGLPAFVWLAGIEFLATGALSWVAWRRCRRDDLILRYDRGTASSLLRQSWLLAVSGAFAVLNLKIDIVFLANMSGELETGIYSAAARLSEVWHVLPAVLMAAMFPTLMKQREAGAKTYRRFVQSTLDLLAISATLIALALTVIATPLAIALYGPQFAGAGPVLALHVWCGVFVFIRALASKWLVAHELYAFSLVSHGAGAAMNISLNLMLIPLYGAWGAALATLVSYALSSWLGFALFGPTRSLFRQMSLALLWPLRVRRAVRNVTGLLR